MNPIKKIARWSLWSASGLMALLIGLHFLLPYLINARPIKNRIVAAAEKAVSGTIGFTQLKIGIFPLPCVVLTDGRIDIPDKLKAKADLVTVYPKILPLMIGRLKIDAVTLKSPAAAIQLTSAGKDTAPSIGIAFPKETAAIKAALSHLPGDFHLVLKNGRLDLLRMARTIARFHGIEARAADENGVLRFNVAGGSNLFDRFQAQADLDRRSLDGSGRIALAGFKSAEVKAAFFSDNSGNFPATRANLQLAFETRGLQTFQCSFDANTPSIGLTRGTEHVDVQKVLIKGTVDLAPAHLQATFTQLRAAAPQLNLSGALSWTQKTQDTPAVLHLSVQARDTDVTALRSTILSLVDGAQGWQVLDIIQGGTLVSMKLDVSGSSWKAIGSLANMKISGKAAGCRIKVPGVDLDLKDVAADWQLSDGVLATRQATARLGDSIGSNGRLKIGLTEDPLPIGLDIDVKADLAQLPSILKKVMPHSEVSTELDRIEALQGSAAGKLSLSGTPDNLKITAAASDINLSASYDRLPYPVTVQGGQLTYDGPGITFKEMNVRVNNSSVNGLSGRVTWQGMPGAALSFNGVIGEQLSQWAYQKFEIPAELRLNMPLTIEELKLSWQRQGETTLNGTFSLTGGLRIATQLTTGPAAFDLQNLTIQDHVSNARITLSHDNAEKAWAFGFDGHLERETLAALWQSGPLRTGWMKGQFSARILTDAPKQSVVNGRLEAGDLTLPFNTLGNVYVHHIDLGSQEKVMDINALDVSWNEQRIALAGKLLFTEASVDMDATVSAEELDLSKIEEILKNDNTGQNSAVTGTKNHLPITGNIRATVGRLIYGQYTLEQVDANIALKEDQMLVDVTDADLCGVSLLGKLRWSPQDFWLEIAPSADKQTFQFTLGCLAGARTTERIEGTYDISGKITTKGTSEKKILRRLQGTIDLNASDGKVFNVGDAGLFTNILSYLKINNLVEGDLPNLKSRDFKYKTIQLELIFHDGNIDLKGANIKASSLNMVGEGTIDMLTQQLDLTVLVSPLTSVDAVVSHIPIVGKVLKGTLIAIPVGVRGPISNPKVIPLSPRAVGSRLIGILERTLQIPFQLVEPILPSSPEKTDEGSKKETRQGRDNE